MVDQSRVEFCVVQRVVDQLSFYVVCRRLLSQERAPNLICVLYNFTFCGQASVAQDYALLLFSDHSAAIFPESACLEVLKPLVLLFFAELAHARQFLARQVHVVLVGVAWARLEALRRAPIRGRVRTRNGVARHETLAATTIQIRAARHYLRVFFLSHFYCHYESFSYVQPF